MVQRLPQHLAAVMDEEAASRLCDAATTHVAIIFLHRVKGDLRIWYKGVCGYGIKGFADMVSGVVRIWYQGRLPYGAFSPRVRA